VSEAPSRPSPEALLRAAAAEGRGRLRLFLGAAPGVGKTYEMLMSARAARAEGVDIVAAVVETHGRAETAALLDGIELIPRHTIEHRGHALAEMDLDAVLARRPKVALVDELAHSNAPGSRHPKRWQDVMELLGAGIDVWSTLNIQHVESLNDIVARITRIRVRETVPDGVITRADAIEVVDLTPEDLIKRLREGRIYLPKVAERALAHYFSPGNLTALRELALRLTAQRVDEQLLDHMQAHAIAGPWAAGERVLVCVTPGGAGPGLVRYGRRLAERLRAAFVALYIETPRAAAEGRDRVEQTLRLAESLGAETVTRPGRDVAAEILAYAREVNATNIVIGTAGIRRLWPFRRRVVERLIADARDIPVHVIGRERAERPERQARTRQAPPPRGWLIAAGAVVLATVLGQGLQVVGGNSSVTMGFLTAILAVATTAGLWPSVAAVIASVLSYNFFFLPPLYTFTIADPRNVVALFFFGIAALVASQLASRLREQTLAARSRARTTEELYGFSRKVAAIASLDDLLWASAYQVASMLRLSVVVLLPEGEGLAVRAGYPPEDVLEEADLAAATLCFRNNKPAGRGADTLPGARRLFIPLATAPGPVGVLGLDAGLDTTPDTPGERSLLGPGQRRLLDALADQIAVAIERIRLAEDVVQAQRHAETERLRSALLTSLSHDLRTPLAAILGAATGLETYGATLPPAERDSLLRTIREEAERLSQFVANLLDMTRLAAGAVTARREPVDLDEAVGSALRRAGRTLDAHRVATDLPAGLPMVDLDPVLFEQVLVNLLDNASKYTPEGSTITLAARAAGDSVELTVEDEGPGIPTDIMPRIFEKFVRAEGADRRRAGTGLGLAICRGFLTAMGATITAANRNDPGHGEHGGAVFTLTLPVHAEGAGA
jgi:two-component system sensor histidine kinase KdpD